MSGRERGREATSERERTSELAERRRKTMSRSE